LILFYDNKKWVPQWTQPAWFLIGVANGAAAFFLFKTIGWI